MAIQTIGTEKLREIYMNMLLTRKFEEKAAWLFSMGRAHGTTHLYTGEEACAAGVCGALSAEDLITSTHRGHGHCISKGTDPGRMMAELLGRAAGCCGGRGGSMHIADLERGNLGENGIVGGGHAIAVGAALTTKMKKIDRIVVCFFGDGASNEGSFHESLNMASVWKLPVLFVCENNLYAMSTPLKRHMNITDISVRAASYGIPGKSLDGNDAVLVCAETMAAREYVKKSGPMLLVLNTYRHMGHSKSDANIYRTQEEIAQWKLKDPIMRMREQLLAGSVFGEAALLRMEEEAAQRIEDAFAFAEASPPPSIDTITEDVYA